jgi:hypothetical protein
MTISIKNNFKIFISFFWNFLSIIYQEMIFWLLVSFKQLLEQLIWDKNTLTINSTEKIAFIKVFKTILKLY